MENVLNIQKLQLSIQFLIMIKFYARGVFAQEWNVRTRQETVHY